MIAGNGGASYTGARRHIVSLCRAAIGMVVALALLTVAVGSAAAASQDGTSNTVQFTVASAVLDQNHHRVVVTSPSLSLNFTTMNVQASGRATCLSGIDACLMEDDGIWLPGA